MGDNWIAALARGTAVTLVVGAGITALAGCSAGRAGDEATGAPTTSAPAASTSTTPSPSETLVEQTPTLTPTLTPTTPAPSLAAVVPLVTSKYWDGKAHELDVSAIVPQVVETGGTCTATATNGSAVVTATGPAGPASSYTGCQTLVLQGAALVPGAWQVRVEYRSDRSQGASASSPVTVG